MDVSLDPHQALEHTKEMLRNIVKKIKLEEERKVDVQVASLSEELSLLFESVKSADVGSILKTRLEAKINLCMANRDKILNERAKNVCNNSIKRWYLEGEKSNKYFLNLLKTKGSITKIDEIIVDGTRFVGADAEAAVVNFYRELYKCPPVQVDGLDPELLKHVKSIDPQAAASTAKEINEGELKRTLQHCRESAPGPDGIGYTYLRKLWHLLGPLVVNSFKHGLVTGNLAESHKTSHLTLIPKKDKDLTQVKNWRPITLSNCDYKLITKTYSNRLAKAVADHVSKIQTAYIKGRSILDNIRLITNAHRIANIDNTVNGLLMALDVTKAFDSVRHDFIDAVLNAFGLSDFGAIFKILYKDQLTNIRINGKILHGFLVERGVKQGDALSCIIFILCMEVLIKNITMNKKIKPISSVTLDYIWPIVFGYADDIQVLISNDQVSINEVFHEYSKFSKMSGLALNSEKTEIFKIGHTNDLETIKIKYNGVTSMVNTANCINVNGIIIGRDSQAMNWDKVITNINENFVAWSKRSLSLIGKIQIYKTFGLSQLLYKYSVASLTVNEERELKNCVFKFLWNSNYLAKKAPDRIKRSIMEQPIELGGFGMLDPLLVIRALKIKQIVKNLGENHPVGQLDKKLIDNSSFFGVKSKFSVDPCVDEYCQWAGQNRMDLLLSEDWELENDRLTMTAFWDENVKQIVEPLYHGSIELCQIRAQKIKTMGELIRQGFDINPNMVKPQYRKILEICRKMPNQLIDLITTTPINWESYSIKGKRKHPSLITTKDIRTTINPGSPVLNSKLLGNIDPEVASSYFKKITKIKSSRLKGNLLRAMHGDIFSNDRCKRFGLTKTDLCDRCGKQDSAKHYIALCEKINPIWETLFKAYEKLALSPGHHNTADDKLHFAVGLTIKDNISILTLHAEIIRRLMFKEKILAVSPLELIRQATTYLHTVENKKFKKKLSGLMQVLFPSMAR